MRYLITLFLIIATYASANAQFYNQGQEPASVRWHQINTSKYKLIYPEHYTNHAQKVAAIIDTSALSLNYGYNLTPRKLPIILHTQNLNSNGFVVWAPKRMEMTVTPPTSTYATPWLKQLAIHEYRHVVQMSNLNQGITKIASYLGGQQITGAAAILLPAWFLEGDATLAETKLSTFGRALQPEFTLEYRAYLEDKDISQFPTDKWFCGSFKDFIPDHYKLGYQLTNMTYKKYGIDFWNRITRYSARNPYFILPRDIAFKRFYKTSSGKMLRETFSQLKEQWDSLEQTNNSTHVLKTEHTSYTLYSYPISINDTTIIALKYDFDKPSRFVSINTKNLNEKIISYTGNVNTRPIYDNGKLLWTEYKPSTFWEQKNSSIIRRMNLSTNKTKDISKGNLFYITKLNDSFAAVEYTYDGKYFIKYLDTEFNEIKRTSIPDSLTIHGMAYDSVTNTLGIIALSEDGMSISKIDGNTITNITHPSFVTINHLEAGSGKFTFNSIASGRDEIHIYDITQNQEYQVTTSRFSSIMPSISGCMLAQVTYSKDGYLVSTQHLQKDSLIELTPMVMPENILNAPIAEFNAVNIDSIKLFDTKEYKPTKKYRKAPHLFNIHSWAPISYDPFELVSDRNLEFDFGATIISQNTLSNTSGYLSYGIIDGNNLLRGSFSYLGFAPKIEINAEYGGGRRDVYGAIALTNSANKQYFSIDTRIYLPINLSHGHLIRLLTPSLRLTHYNAMIFDATHKKFDEGYQKVEASLTYTQNVRRAYRDIAPRWGYSAKASYNGAPFNDMFGSLYSVLLGAYTPGFMPHHSLRIRAAAQTQDSKFYNFRSNILFPRRCNYNIAPEKILTATADYKFPLFYPDGGISNFIYFKRIVAGVFGGYSHYKEYSLTYETYSYGLDFILNTKPLRMSKGELDIEISIYKNNQSKSIGLGFGVSIGI